MKGSEGKKGGNDERLQPLSGVWSGSKKVPRGKGKIFQLKTADFRIRKRVSVFARR